VGSSLSGVYGEGEDAMVLKITPWERAALQSLANGKTPSEIANRFRVSDREVEILLATLFSRMGVRGQLDAIAAASRRGLIMRDDELIAKESELAPGLDSEAITL
jgi:DNA-binding NarL/FixJ family response regulator